MHLMRSDGFQCLEGGNGLEALRQLEQHPVTLLMSDIRMPEMNGIELLREVRARYPETAVMMVSAVLDVDAAVQCLSLGAMDYLVKPYQLDEVRARVQQALEKRRLLIENRAYQEQLEQRVLLQTRKIEHTFLAAIQGFSSALEYKDPYTRGHSDRVSHYSTVIGKLMALDDELLRQIELGGHVHDIGKIGVREAVLNKAGPLTREEYEHIMTHPVVGWEILKPLLGDAPHALHIVRSHHERYDGRGIPDGLAGEEIPLEARIAAAADSLDAMTSDRPYRPSEMTLEMAIDELLRCAGTQFDRDVVAAIVAGAAAGTLQLMPRSIITPPGSRTGANGERIAAGVSA